MAEVKNEAAVEEVAETMTKMTVSGKPYRKVAGNYPIHLGFVTPHNVMQFKRLNEACFPVSYNDKFYSEVRFAGELAKLAYYNDVVVGAVACRNDMVSDEKALYIMTLGTLAPYRQLGIGTILINHVLKLANDDPDVRSIYLHVQTSNQNALNFYEKHGFTNEGVIDNYYRISPSDAYLLVKKLN